MRFDCLLWQCLAPGLYEGDDGLPRPIRVALQPQRDETVLLFDTDSSAFRGGRDGVKACDLLFFYSGPRSKVPVLLFVELKGSRPEVRAHLQVANTVKSVLAQLHETCSGTDPIALEDDPSLAKPSHVRVVAVVVLGEAAPQQTKQERKALFQQYRLAFEYRHNPRDGSVTDLRDLLT